MVMIPTELMNVAGFFFFYLHEQIVNNWPITDIFPLVVEITQKHSCIFFDHHLMEEREKKKTSTFLLLSHQHNGDL